jgi:serine/threonine protein kinase
MQALYLNQNDTVSTDLASNAVRELLDAYAEHQLSDAALQERIVEICRRDVDASWSTLSWLDQFHRRGVIDETLFRDLKERVVRVAIPIEAPARAGSDNAFEPASPPPRVDVTESDGVDVHMSEDAPAGDAPEAPIATHQYSIDDRAIEPPEAEPGLLPAAKSSVAVPQDEARRFAPGSMLRNRYELKGELGRGGMGTVYRARDRERRNLDGLSEFIALKVLREDWVSRPDALAALRQECFRAQLLSHPNIVNVFDWDRDGDTCFVTMELVEGETLSHIVERIRPGKLERDQALAIITVIGSALAHAHANGIVHADLKPGNVMIGHDGRVLVLDFGLARPILREPSFGSSRLRAATPAYSSPEVLRGLNAVPRDDIFSFGCLAYELLGGSAPFPRLSVAEARRGRPMPRRPAGMRSREWRVIRKALAPQREARPASVEQMLTAFAADSEGRVAPLRRLIDGARRPPDVRLGRWIAAAALATVAITTGVAWQRDALPGVDSASISALLDSLFVPSPVGSRPASSPANAAVEASSEPLAPPIAAADQQEMQVDASAAGSSMASRMNPPGSEPAAPSIDPGSGTSNRPANERTDTGQAVAAGTMDASDPASGSATAARGVAPKTAALPIATGPPVLAMTARSVTVSERDGVVRLTVVRSGALADPLEFRWWTEPAEATRDDDFADLGVRVERFQPGQSAAVLLIPIVGDAVRESTETFSVRIGTDAPAANVDTADTTVVIVDDD